MDSLALAKLPIPPFPPLEIRQKAVGWEDCIQSWSLICKSFLNLPDELFATIFQSASLPPVVGFLVSYVENDVGSQHDESWKLTGHGQRLGTEIYLIIHRVLSRLSSPPDPILQWSFLGQSCKIFRNQATLHDLMQLTWVKHSEKVEGSLQQYKDVLTGRFEKQKGQLTNDGLFANALLPLLRACPLAGTFFLTGSDLFDSIIAAYINSSAQDRPNLLLLAYIMVLAPLQVPKANTSLLRDHLFNLRADAEKVEQSNRKQHSLLSDLATDTPFLAKLRKHARSSPDQSRSMSLISSVEKFQRAESRQLRPRQYRSKNTREHAKDIAHSGSFDPVHVHRMSKVSQIQDLFPDLGSGYIVRLLTEYDDDAEQVTAHLLEDNLPPHLQGLDRSEQYITRPTANSADLVPDLAPHSTPPPSTPIFERRNVFDNDEFDRLAVPESRVYLGHKDTDGMIREQDPATRNAAKAAILSALAAFDADDDERDDTYDLEDVGGTVDKAQGPDGDDDAMINDLKERSEEALFSAWRINPAAFGRDSTTRRGAARQALKTETHMTDEAIEGWALMLSRDSGRLRKLEAKYATFGGQQQELKSTAWRGGPETDDEGTSGAETPRGGHGGFRGRGRGRGRGGSVSGPSDDKGTKVSRDRKEANKGSRANHNRRDQRARKMARGGGMMG